MSKSNKILTVKNSACTKSEFIIHCIKLAEELAQKQNITLKTSHSFTCLITEFYDSKVLDDTLTQQILSDFYTDIVELLTAEIDCIINSELKSIWLIGTVSQLAYIVQQDRGYILSC